MVISVDIVEAILVDIMVTIMVDAIIAGTTGVACVLLLIGVIIVVGVTVGRGSIGDGDGHIPTPIIGDGHITIPTIGGGPIPITPMIQRLFPRHMANRNSSNPIIGTSVRTHRVTTLMSKIVLAVG